MADRQHRPVSGYLSDAAFEFSQRNQRGPGKVAGQVLPWLAHVEDEGRPLSLEPAPCFHHVDTRHLGWLGGGGCAGSGHAPIVGTGGAGARMGSRHASNHLA